jgi:PAS domain S-box-containing protein
LKHADFSYGCDLQSPKGTFTVHCSPCHGDNDKWAVVVRLEPEARFLSKQLLGLGVKHPFWFLLDNLKLGFWAIDRQARTVQVSPQLGRMLGYLPEEMLGRTVTEFMDEEWKEKCRHFLDRRKLGIQEIHEFTFLRSNGQPLKSLLVTTPLYDSLGQFDGAIAFVQDSDDQWRTERERDIFRAKLKELRERIWLREQGLRREFTAGLQECLFPVMRKVQANLEKLNEFPFNFALIGPLLQETLGLLEEANVSGEEMLRRLSEDWRGHGLFPDEEDLNGNEIAVLRCLADGLGSKEIAKKLGKSIKTIEYYRKKVLAKTGAENLAGLIKYAMRKGYIGLD